MCQARSLLHMSCQGLPHPTDPLLHWEWCQSPGMSCSQWKDENREEDKSSSPVYDCMKNGS